jgi:AcrR family transcriptional regulator
MDTLTKILGASAELFRQYGFKTITMDDIARRAGVSKKTLYQHFANKNEVVRETMIWFMDRMIHSCRELCADTENAVAAMVQMIELFGEARRNTNPKTLVELQRYHPEAYEVFRDYLMKHDVEMIRTNILQGIADGLYRPELNADLLARYYIETSLLIFQPSLLVHDLFDLRTLHREVAELFLYGIMTPKGEKLYRKYKEKFLKK